MVRTALGALGIAVLGSCSNSGAERPNLLLIVADDMSQRELGLYADVAPNPEPPPTPNLDRLAELGVRFTGCHANPLCTPSRATILTGRYSFRTSVGANVQRWEESHFGLPLEETTLPEMLAPHYATAVIGKWHVNGGTPVPERGYVPELAPQLHGFDHYRAGTFWGHPFRAPVLRKETDRPYRDWIRNDDGVETVDPEYATRAQFDAAVELVNGELEEPWFLYLSLNAPHRPYHTPPADLLPTGYPEPVTDREKYEAMVVATDTKLGDLLDVVDMDRTCVLFLSDNGTPSDVAHPLQDPERVKSKAYREGVEVILLAAGAGVPTRGGVCRALVNTVDIAATLAELAGVELGAGVAQDSVSFAPYFADPALPSRRDWVLSERFFPLHEPRGEARALRTRDFKLMLWRENEAPPLTEEVELEEVAFYDLRVDPWEEVNLLEGEMTPEQETALHEIERDLEQLLASEPIEHRTTGERVRIK